jgi:hypothetical protein
MVEHAACILKIITSGKSRPLYLDALFERITKKRLGKRTLGWKNLLGRAGRSTTEFNYNI